MKIASFGLLAALSLSAQFVAAGTIQLNIEEPAASSTYNGVANIRGWTFSSVEMKSVKLSIDQGDYFEVPTGGVRYDVGLAFPDSPNAGHSGFSMAYSYQKLSAGTHNIRVLAEDVDGAQLERSVTFKVVRFDSNWISSADSVDTSSAVVTIDGDSIRLSNLYVDGVAYDTVLDWRNAIQGYTFSKIDQVGTLSECYEVRQMMGSWTYSVIADKAYPFSYNFYQFNETPSSDFPCVAWAEDDEGEINVLGWYDADYASWYVYDKIDVVYDWYYKFDFDSADAVSGSLTIYQNGTESSSYDMTGERDATSALRQARSDRSEGAEKGAVTVGLLGSGQGSREAGVFPRDPAVQAAYLRDLIKGPKR